MATGGGAATTPTFSPLTKYALLCVTLVISVLGAYVLKVFPDLVGFAGAGTSIAGLFAFASADLEANADPKPIPTGTTFVFVTVAAGIYGAVGYWTNQTLYEWTAFLAWGLIVLEYVLTTFRSQLEQYVPSQWDSAIVAGLGLTVTLAQYLASNPGASLDALVITGVVWLASYLNNSSSPVPAPSSSTAPTTSS